MAKPEKGKIKIRFFEVEVEGSDETLLESVRSAAALANRGQTIRTVKALAPAMASAAASQEQDAEVLSEELSDTAESEQEAGTKSKKTRSYPTLEIVDIDFKSGTRPFADFAQTKNPSSTTKKYLVCATWLKEEKSISEIDANHIWTCFRHLGWGVPKDVMKPLQNGTQNGYFKNPSRGKYEITHIGLDAVDKMKSAAAVP